jgi:predicted GTPase
MGPTGSGKSTVCYVISEVSLPYFLLQFVEKAGGRCTVGYGIRSCTQEIQWSRVTNFTDFDKPVVFVDTPGFGDTYKSDAEVLGTIADWVAQRLVRIRQLRCPCYN